MRLVYKRIRSRKVWIIEGNNIECIRRGRIEAKSRQQREGHNTLLDTFFPFLRLTIQRSHSQSQQSKQSKASRSSTCSLRTRLAFSQSRVLRAASLESDVSPVRRRGMRCSQPARPGQQMADTNSEGRLLATLFGDAIESLVRGSVGLDRKSVV